MKRRSLLTGIAATVGLAMYGKYLPEYVAAEPVTEVTPPKPIEWPEATVTGWAISVIFDTDTSPIAMMPGDSLEITATLNWPTGKERQIWYGLCRDVVVRGTPLELAMDKSFCWHVVDDPFKPS